MDTTLGKWAFPEDQNAISTGPGRDFTYAGENTPWDLEDLGKRTSGWSRNPEGNLPFRWTLFLWPGGRIGGDLKGTRTKLFPMAKDFPLQTTR